jgi:hypothetical protein
LDEVSVIELSCLLAKTKYRLDTQDSPSVLNHFLLAQGKSENRLRLTRNQRRRYIGVQPMSAPNIRHGPHSHINFPLRQSLGERGSGTVGIASVFVTAKQDRKNGIN